jgi:hypothetical protein
VKKREKKREREREREREEGGEGVHTQDDMPRRALQTHEERGQERMTQAKRSHTHSMHFNTKAE